MAVTVSIYNCFKSDLTDKVVDLVSDTIKVALYDASGTFTATDTTYATTNELATAGGYTQGGATLTTKTVTGTTTAKWDADDATWTGSGAGFTAFTAMIYSTTNSNRLIAHVDFGAGQVVGTGIAFNIKWDTNGILTIS